MSLPESPRSPQEPQPSPRKLNSALQNIYFQFPAFNLDQDLLLAATVSDEAVAQIADQTLRDENRRKRSEHKEVLFIAAESLVTQSALTSTGQTVLLYDLSNTYDRGINKENPGLGDQFYSILEIGDQKGGIFNKNRVLQLELAYYQARVKMFRRLRLMFEQLPISPTPQQRVQIERTIQAEEANQFAISSETFNQWRSEIIQKHGIDPEKPTSAHPIED